MKYIFVTGGVVSSLGKGITAASLGRLLEDRGLKVSVQKLDPYLNVDPGTINPSEHGEVFVTKDGLETDLDIGHYERFVGKEFDNKCNFTSGKIYDSIIKKEREGKFLGSTIQIIPHVTNEIKSAMRSYENTNNDVSIIEVGGTIGDIESIPFLEAIRELEYEVGEHNFCHIHVALVPFLESAGEIKTKPTQHSVKELTSLGLRPNIIVCRVKKDSNFNYDHKKKIAMFCGLTNESFVVKNENCDSLYEVPLMLKKEKLDDLVLEVLKIKAPEAKLISWNKMLDKMKNAKDCVDIAIVGKYIKIQDSYISVIEAIKHAGIENMINTKTDIVSAEDVEKFGAENILQKYDAIIVPGGFGERGIEGKILTAKYCREHNVPYLGICLGMQIAVIEYARNVLNLKNANSTEFDAKTPYPIVSEMAEQKNLKQMGATMRLGNYDCKLKQNTLANKLYSKSDIVERHRHRFEFNNAFKGQFEQSGIIFSGINAERNLVEIFENPKCNFFIACQFHPEFKSHPDNPHPLFVGLINMAKQNKK